MEDYFFLEVVPFQGRAVELRECNNSGRTPSITTALKQSTKRNATTRAKLHENRKITPEKIVNPGIPTTIKTMVVNITTIVYLRVLIIQIGSTIILMVVEAQGKYMQYIYLGSTPPPSNSGKWRFIGIPDPKNVMSSWWWLASWVGGRPNIYHTWIPGDWGLVSNQKEIA